MDTALQNAEALRDRIAQKINEKMQEVDDLRRELDRAERFIADWYDFSGTSAPQLTEEISKHVDNSRRRTTGNPKKEAVAKAARRIIEEAGEPIERFMMYQHLSALGLTVDGANPEKTLSTMLWRMSKAENIIHLRGHGYWLGERPYAPANWNPVSETTIMEPTH